MCSEGDCVCSKTKGKYVVGDGTTQGSCTSSAHKCQSDGTCVECLYDSECAVLVDGRQLSDKCVLNKCVCGTSGSSCNATRSNLCTNGVCMCGTNLQCANELKIEDDPNCNLAPTTQEEFDELQNVCSYNKNDNNCKIQRSPQEVCEKITEYYNPLYVKGEIKSEGGAPDDVNIPCDDGKGKYLGEYHCLGKYI